MPANPLSAVGLATPYQLIGCDETDPGASAFVQAVIISPLGKVSVYPPLVVNEGTIPAVPPVPPVILPGSTVGIWFGFNGDVLIPVGPGASACTGGLPGSPFGQMIFCNAQEFFRVANNHVRIGSLPIPPLGNDRNGEVCPSIRSFKIGDQDPSDNVETQYLFKGKQTIQNTVVNRQTHPGWQVVSNPSDNRFLTALIDPVVGCTPWLVPNASDPGGPPVPALPLNEIQAAKYQAPPIAYVPLGSPLTLVNGDESVTKTNLYRAGVNQPMIGGAGVGDTSGSDASFCAGLRDVFPDFLFANRGVLSAAPSPEPDAANSLFTFAAVRFVASYETDMRNPCPPPPDPITLVMEGAVAVDVQLTADVPPTTTTEAPPAEAPPTTAAPEEPAPEEPAPTTTVAPEESTTTTTEAATEEAAAARAPTVATTLPKLPTLPKPGL